MRGRAGDIEIGYAHHPHALKVKRLKAVARCGLVGEQARPQPVLLEKLREHRRRRFVERPPARQAEHGSAGGPGRRGNGGDGDRGARGGQLLLGKGRRHRPAIAGGIGTRSIVMIGKVADKGRDRLLDMGKLRRGESAAGRIGGSELETFQRDLVIIRGKRTLLEQQFGLVEHLVGIAGEHSLIEAFWRRQSGSVAEHHVEKLEPVHVPAQHHQAEGERS